MYVNKKVLLVVLSFLVGVMVFNLFSRSGDSGIKSVTSRNVITENQTVICFHCRKKIPLQDFEETSVPNMMGCPQCGKQMLKTLLIGQVALKKR